MVTVQGSEPEKVSIILADDHSMVREGLVKIIDQISDAEILAQAENGLEAISLTKALRPDLLILDAAMPLANGIEVLADCRRWSPKSRIVLMTGFTSGGILNEWLQANVDAILLKSCSPEETLEGLETVIAGGRFICKAAQKILDDRPDIQALTMRETEVLSLIAKGFGNEAIGERLCISKRTVEKHRASLMQKVGAKTVAELLVFALKEGLLDSYKQL